MTPFAYVLIFSAAGFLLGVLVAVALTQRSFSKRAAELDGRARSAEAIVGEIRESLRQRESEIAAVRKELDLEKQSKTAALTRFDEAQKTFQEQRALLETMKKEMADTFNALSAAAMRSNSEDFLRLASEHLGKVVVDTGGKLGEHKAALEGLIRPLHDTLKRYEEQIRLIEENRHKSQGSLQEQLRALASTHENLQRETSNLVSALRRPEVRGRWGEMQLRRVAELSGMSAHCDFSEQQSVDSERGKFRPDMIVHLPANREIVVDAKVSLEAYLSAVAARSEDDRRAMMARHAQHIRSHITRLASKEYWSQFKSSPEFVVLFIPGESFLSSALDSDSSLIEDGIEKKVIIATPTTFIALLRAVAYGWRQEEMAKNAQLISDLGRQLYDRMTALTQHLHSLGAHLDKAVGSFNRTVGSLESRVLPSIRKFKELGVTGAEEISDVVQIDQAARKPEVLPADSDAAD